MRSTPEAENMLVKKSDQKFCFSCGIILHISAVSCSKCGARQPQSSSPPNEAPSSNISTAQQQKKELPINHIYCRGCGEPIHTSAVSCPKCGYAALESSTRPDKQQWISIASFIIGLLCFLALFDDSPWDLDTIVGMIVFAVLGIVFGVIGITQNSDKKGLAIAGIVLAILGALGTIGSL